MQHHTDKILVSKRWHSPTHEQRGPHAPFLYVSRQAVCTYLIKYFHRAQVGVPHDHIGEVISQNAFVWHIA